MNCSCNSDAENVNNLRCVCAVYREHNGTYVRKRCVAAAGASLFTNPLEVIKVRMQIQGELAAHGQYVLKYKNFAHAGYMIAKHDGVSTLQAGLVPAMWFQLVLNGFRLGLYDFFISKGLVRSVEGDVIICKTIIASALTGAGGCLLASPFCLIKTHIQTKAAEEIAFGYQHNHKSMWQGLKTIYFGQGIRGLFRGASASVPRALIGSSSQITSFEYAKELLRKYEIWQNHPIVQIFSASMLSGISITLMMQPFDLISNRMYNQGVDCFGNGLLYNNYVDCVLKIWKTEEPFGFYKGLVPAYFRFGPHTVLCLVLWDELKYVHRKLYTTI